VTVVLIAKISHFHSFYHALTPDKLRHRSITSSFPLFYPIIHEQLSFAIEIEQKLTSRLCDLTEWNNDMRIYKKKPSLTTAIVVRRHVVV
jgi:hypothetical protein